jgi:plastocyanin
MRLIGTLGALSLALAACGQPQSDATLDSPAAAASALPIVAETTSAAPTATEQPTEQATAPAEQATTMPTATVEASPTVSAMAHDHMASAAPAAQLGGPEVAASIKLFMFSPEPLEVDAGTTVVWTNQDDIQHSVTSGAAPMADGAFDSDFFTKDQTYAFTFSQPGEYSYFCKRHPSMIGTVKVR